MEWMTTIERVGIWLSLEIWTVMVWKIFWLEPINFQRPTVLCIWFQQTHLRDLAEHTSRASDRFSIGLALALLRHKLRWLWRRSCFGPFGRHRGQQQGGVSLVWRDLSAPCNLRLLLRWAMVIDSYSIKIWRHKQRRWKLRILIGAPCRWLWDKWVWFTFSLCPVTQWRSCVGRPDALRRASRTEKQATVAAGTQMVMVQWFCSWTFDYDDVDVDVGAAYLILGTLRLDENRSLDQAELIMIGHLENSAGQFMGGIGTLMVMAIMILPSLLTTDLNANNAGALWDFGGGTLSGTIYLEEQLHSLCLVLDPMMVLARGLLRRGYKRWWLWRFLGHGNGAVQRGQYTCWTVQPIHLSPCCSFWAAFVLQSNIGNSKVLALIPSSRFIVFIRSIRHKDFPKNQVNQNRWEHHLERHGRHRIERQWSRVWAESFLLRWCKQWHPDLQWGVLYRCRFHNRLPDMPSKRGVFFNPDLVNCTLIVVDIDAIVAHAVVNVWSLVSCSSKGLKGVIDVVSLKVTPIPECWNRERIEWWPIVQWVASWKRWPRENLRECWSGFRLAVRSLKQSQNRIIEPCFDLRRVFLIFTVVVVISYDHFAAVQRGTRA